MSYVIIGDLFTFPEGEAATNRVHTYAKGFHENGVNVHVISFGNVYSDQPDGSYEGIFHYRPFGQRKRSGYFVVRTWQKIMKYVKTITLVRKINREDKIKIIIVYSGLPGTFIFAWILARLTRSKLLQEMSEHPMRYFQDGWIMKQFGQMKVRTESILVDGIFCISHYLMDFYLSRGFREGRLLLIPSTVDPGRFQGPGNSPLDFPYIGYFGALSIGRDNVDLLIEAFALISDKHPSLRLVIGGKGRENEKARIAEIIAGLGMTDRIIMLPYLSREEITRYIDNSLILIMVRADDFKSKASFPSKLTEYLATSRPVISVNVGEISEYLTDGQNCYLVEPGNKYALAQKIDHVLSEYNVALNVAGKGQELAKTIFNYSYQAKKMISFIESLK